MKDVQRRLDSARVARWDLAAAPQHTSDPGHRYLRVVVATVLSAMAGAAVMGLFLRPSTSETSVATHPNPKRFEIKLPPGISVGSEVRQPLTLSADGRVLVVRGRRGQGASYYVRYMDRDEFLPIGGTARERGEELGSAFVSPDGHWLAFVDHASSTLSKVQIEGGRPTPLTRLSLPAGEESFRGASWSPDGARIVYSQDRDGLFLLRSDGGTPRRITQAENGGAAPTSPQFTTDGSAVVFWRAPAATPLGEEVWMMPAEGGVARKLTVEGQAPVPLLGSFLFYRGGQAWVAPAKPNGDVDVSRSTMSFDGVRRYVAGITPTPQFAVAREGSIAYLPSEAQAGSVVAVVDERAKSPMLVQGIAPGNYSQVRVSPDGSRVALGTNRSEHIWLHSMVDHTTVRMQTQYADDRYPLWTVDGRGLVFTATIEGVHTLIQAPVDGIGSPSILMQAPAGATDIAAEEWAPDGRTLLFYEGRDGQIDIGTLAPGSPPQFRRNATTIEAGPRVSRALGLVAYHSNASGRFEIYAAGFPDWKDQIQVSVNGGRAPVWSIDGRSVRWVTPDGSEIWEAEMARIEGLPRVIARRMLMNGSFAPTSGSTRSLDVASDGRMFILTPSTNSSQTTARDSVVFLSDWLPALTSRQ